MCTDADTGPVPVFVSKKQKTFQRKRIQTGQDSSRFVGVPKCFPQVLPPSASPSASPSAPSQFIEDNKAEIEAISILYSRPYAAGLRYSQVKELARRLSSIGDADHTGDAAKRPRWFGPIASEHGNVEAAGLV